MRNSVAILTLFSSFLLAQPSFTAADIVSNLAGASAVSAADMDGDGDLDIIAADEGGDAIHWLENDGAANPSFTVNSLASSVDGPWALFPIDLDQDLYMYVISGSHSDNKVRWFSNNGNADPSFTAADLIIGADARGVHSGDVVGDGYIDLVVASGTGSKVYWAENNGSQSFTLHTLINNGAGGMRSVFMIDIDSDGDLSLIHI